MAILRTSIEQAFTELPQEMINREIRANEHRLEYCLAVNETRTKTKIRRLKIWKSLETLCYAIIYGMGAESLAHEINTTKVEAQSLINRFFQLFPKVKCWIESRMEKCRETMYAETFLGRKKQFVSNIGDIQKDEKKMGRQCINYIIQGTASEMFRKALIYVDKRLQDELIVEAPQGVVEQTAIILKDSMEKAFHRFLKDGEQAKLRFPVKLSAGQNWGHLERLDFCDIAIRTRDEKTIELAVDRNSTVEHLIARLQKLTGTEGKKQFLLYQGQQLDEGMTLAHYDIEQDCLLAFTDRLRAGKDRSAAPFYVTVFIEHNGEKQGYSLPENATVQQLMNRIQAANGGQCYKQFLSLNGFRLCLLRPLSFYNIDDDSVVQLNDVCYSPEKPKKVGVVGEALVKLGLRSPPKPRTTQNRRIRVPAISKFGPYMLPADPKKARTKEPKTYYDEDDEKKSCKDSEPEEEQTDVDKQRHNHYKKAYFGDDDESKCNSPTEERQKEKEVMMDAESVQEVESLQEVQSVQEVEYVQEIESVESVKSMLTEISYHYGENSSLSSGNGIEW